MSKLLNNLPIEDLTKENDYLGIIDKGDIIKTFLEINTDEFKDIKMFSLYGEWGSGKSTLMKYLEKELKGNFNTFFFEAWQYESDNNLSISLLEYLTYETSDSTEEAFGEIVEVAAKLFKGFSKSIRITVPGLSIDGNKIVESLEEEPEESFYQLKRKFENEFIRWETNITKGKSPKYNIVFIDDLDRCEPENVLNLLSALKLFFTYGEKTIFFCGIDKNAIKEAVRTKYNEAVKSSEYLEKVFDITFSMPFNNDISKLISLLFDDRKINEFIPDPWNRFITMFFLEIEFTNPRRIKKVLNKFTILQRVKDNSKLSNRYKRHIPNIYFKNQGNILETILVLYVIVLHEFYQDKYENLFDLKHKEYIIIKSLKNNNNTNTDYNTMIQNYLNQTIINKEIKIINFSNGGKYDDLIFTLLPDTLVEMGVNSYEKYGFENMKFSEITIEYKFLKFLIRNGKIFMGRESCSEITLIELKTIVKNAL